MAKNNATDKLIGFDFQKLIALEACFNGKPGSVVYLECYGDVSDGSTTSTEVKHHDGKFFLTDRTIDFWKTLRNLIVDFATYQYFDEFIIHTTSAIGKGSIFENWASTAQRDRLTKVRGVSPNQTIKDYHDEVAKTSDKILQAILSKLIIKSDQPTIQEQYKILVSHPILKSIDPTKADAVIERLHGKISLLAVHRKDNWHITQDDFLITFRSECRNYLIDELIFPIISNKSIDVNSLNKDYHFCMELKAIAYDEAIDNAIVNYLRASGSQIQMLTDRPGLVDSLGEYEEALKDEMIFNKDTHANEIKVQQVTSNIEEYSRKLFTDCMKSPSVTIKGIVNIQAYYPRGRMHRIVERGEFSWIFKES